MDIHGESGEISGQEIIAVLGKFGYPVDGNIQTGFAVLHIQRAGAGRVEPGGSGGGNQKQKKQAQAEGNYSFFHGRSSPKLSFFTGANMT